MTSSEIVRTAVSAIEDKKGEDIRVIDISKVSVIADYFIIAGGNNTNQTQAIADEIQDRLTKNRVEPRDVEGYRNGSWILLDYGDTVIHIFNRDDRRFYNLERIWADGKVITDLKQMQ
jgi:ribosome-associated protein